MGVNGHSVDRVQRKREQNKLSQRVHRARKAARIEALEEEVQRLRNQVKYATYNEENLKLRRLLIGVCQKINDVVHDVEMVEKVIGVKLLNQSTKELLEATKVDPLDNLLDAFLDDALWELSNNVSKGDYAEPNKLESSEFHPIGNLSTNSIYENNLPSSERVHPSEINLLLQEFKYPISKTIPNALSVNPSFSSVQQALKSFIDGFANSITKLDSITTPDRRINPKVVSIVKEYAEEFLYVTPKLRNYTVALGGSKWLCGQFLVSCTQFLNNHLKHSNENGGGQLNASLQKIRMEVEEVSKPELWNGDLKTWIQEVFPSKNNSQSGIQIDYNSDEIRNRYFKVTPLQKYFIEHSINYDLSVNLVIWPEFRDSLLRNAKEMHLQEYSDVFDVILDNVVLVIYGENGESNKMFFMKNFMMAINLTRNNEKSNISLETLIRNGVNYPWCWKVTKTFASRYLKIVPRSIVCEIDENRPENIVLP